MDDVAEAEPRTPPPEIPNEEPEQPVGTDPTVAHAGLTEIGTQPEPITNGASNHVDTANVPSTSQIDAEAANATGGGNWEAQVAVRGGDEAPSGEDVVQVDRNPTETDTGTDATPAAMTSTQSWAEDVPAASDPMPQPTYTQTTTANGTGDDFREVQHHRGGRGRGGLHRVGDRRGRGGHKVDREGGGRGRGGNRGDRGGGRGRGGGHKGREQRGGGGES